MSSLITRMRNDYAVYWAVTGMNKFGKPLYADPVEVRCRWVDQKREIKTPEGSVFNCNALVWIDRVMPPVGVLWHGRLVNVVSESDPFANPSAYEIKMTKDNPNFHNTEILRSVYL